MIKRILLCIVIYSLLSACLAPTPTLIAIGSTKTTVPKTVSPTVTHSPTPNVTDTPIPSSTQTPEATFTLPVSPTIQNTSTPVSPTDDTIFIDHTSIALFDHIPDVYIRAASKITLLFQHASVGANISLGLDCMRNYFPTYPDPNRRPYACDRDLDSTDIIIDPKYDCSNWTFEPRTSDVWREIIFDFIKRIDNLGANENYQVVSFDYGYFIDPEINDYFFTKTAPDDKIPDVFDLEALQARHPDTTLVWWTTELARESQPHLTQFNQHMREYALANHVVLMDIADIESHLPDGTPCTGIDSSNNPTDIPSICDEYANEVLGGHLNSLGRVQGAKAFWVMMARLAGWEPQG